MEICFELRIVSIAIVKKKDKKAGPWQTWKKRQIRQNVRFFSCAFKFFIVNRNSNFPKEQYFFKSVITSIIVICINSLMKILSFASWAFSFVFLEAHMQHQLVLIGGWSIHSPHSFQTGWCLLGWLEAAELSQSARAPLILLQENTRDWGLFFGLTVRPTRIMVS